MGRVPPAAGLTAPAGVAKLNGRLQGTGGAFPGSLSTISTRSKASEAALTHHEGQHSHPVPITRSAARIGRMTAFGVNLMVALSVLALASGSFAVRSHTRTLDTANLRQEIAARKDALQVELVDLNQSLDGVFQELLAARGVAGRARSVIGLGGEPEPDASDGSSAVRANADLAALSDSTLAGAMLNSAVQVEETLREARQLKASFEEILAGMEARGSAWARIPSLRPVIHARLSSDFGIRRDPFTGRLAFHKGLDLAVPKGTPVHAPAEGRVIRAGRYHGYGLLVEIDHGNGIHTRYGHNSRLAVRPGQMVRRGQVISYVGQTGRASAPHLHYEVLLHGRAVNPEPYILPEFARAD
jgi:murein DD-endopeptidase MepM/ murein hydrolase activator NlpD